MSGDVLTDAITAVVMAPPGTLTVPEAAVYFIIGERLVLADLSTPIGDSL